MCLTKICLKSSKDSRLKHTVKALIIIVGVGRMAELKRGERVGVYADSLDRLTTCCRILLDPVVNEKLNATFLHTCQQAFSGLVAKQNAIKVAASDEEDRRGRTSQADDLIQFRQLRAQAVQGVLRLTSWMLMIFREPLVWMEAVKMLPN